ncbi:MAG TPA: class I SAM-dependent methyltransferase [Balneolaceae bacterium]
MAVFKPLSNLVTRFSFQLLVICGFLFLSSPYLWAQDLDVPFVPTPENVVEQMLDVANVNSSDYVIDLGSGDGRIVIAAAKRGATGHGVDLDPQRIKEARANAAEANVDDQIMFMQKDLFETDFSRASVITMYLLPSVNKQLRPKLLEELEPGTRIVSHDFDMGDWKPDKQLTVNNENGGGSHEVYFWVIPAKTSGNWSWSADGKDFTMDINQRYQEIDVSLTDGNGNSYDVKKATLHGSRIKIRAGNDGQHYIFSGRVEGDEITGMVQHHNGDENEFSMWSATRE